MSKNEEAEFIEKLKKEGKIPSDTKFIKKLTDEDIGRTVIFSAKIKSIRIKTSPQIGILIEHEGRQFEEGFTTQFCGKNIKIEGGYLITDTEYTKNSFEGVEYFNKVISLFNILGIPLEEVTIANLIIDMEGLGRRIETITSTKAKKTSDFKVLIKQEAMFSLILAMTAIWQKIEKSKYPNIVELFPFLGKCRYYFFHESYFNSFINGWIFLECIINLFWEDEINRKFTTNPPKKEDRDYTTNIKINDLFLTNRINLELKDEIHKLRKKRNDIFHLRIKKEAIKVSEKDALDCMVIGLNLFYKAINFELGEGKVIDFVDIRKTLYSAMNYRLK